MDPVGVKGQRRYKKESLAVFRFIYGMTLNKVAESLGYLVNMLTKEVQWAQTYGTKGAQETLANSYLQIFA